jgi:hypothetical protein
MKIQYSTISNNSVKYFANGGGVASVADSSTTRTEVTSSIISGNFSTEDMVNPDSDLDAVDGNGTNSFVSFGYNVVGVSAPSAPAVATDAFNQPGDQTEVTDPGLFPLGLNGGPTFTHALEPDSPALDAGDPGAVSGVGNVPEFDQRGGGFDRVLGFIDVGSFEANLAPVIPFDPADLNQDGFVDGLDLGILLGNWGMNVSPEEGELNDTTPVNGLDLGILLIAWNPQPAPVMSAAVSSSTPAAAAAARQPLPLSIEAEASSLVSLNSEPESVGTVSAAANPDLGSVVIIGLGSASPDLSSSQPTVERSETAAIDESLAQMATDSSLGTPRRDDLEDHEFVSLSSTGEESEEDFSAEDSVFEMLGKQLV